MSAVDYIFLGSRLVPSTDSAPSGASDGFKLGVSGQLPVSEVWVFVTAAAGTGFTADMIPWVFFSPDPKTPLPKVWGALALVDAIPLDGEQVTTSKGQLYLLDIPAHAVTERVFTQFTAVGAELRVSLYGGIRQR